MGGHFDIPKLEKKLEELKLEINKDSFWENFEYATSINKEYAKLSKLVNNYNKINEDIETLELMQSELEENEYNSELDKIKKELDIMERETHLNGKFDNLNCYLEIHPGAGGTESCDWAAMLLRMYERFCEKYNYKYEIIYETPGDEAGIKSALLQVSGDMAYGYLKRENGIHRLVRISPFDSGARRHTSFASVKITPEFIETKEIEIKESDLKIDVFHSSGAGGQSVNTSNSAVRITHLPTKIVVNCQNERSQLKNKDMALKILKNKLYELQLEEERKKKEKINASNKNIDFGSQIRSYILEPYKLVKDTRSNFESNEPEKILDGNILELLEFNLKNIKESE